MSEAPIKTGDLLKILGSLTNHLDVLSKKGSFRMGLGTLAMGCAVLIIERICGITIISVGAFFVASRVGGLIDEKISSKKVSKEK